MLRLCRDNLFRDLQIADTSKIKGVRKKYVHIYEGGCWSEHYSTLSSAINFLFISRPLKQVLCHHKLEFILLKDESNLLAGFMGREDIHGILKSKIHCT